MSGFDVDYKYVRTNADMTAVAAHYGIELKGKGDQKTGHCPFHDDTRPSLKVNTGKRVFNCFACGNGGNVLDFVTALDDDVANVLQAAKKVAELSGIATKPNGEVVAAGTAPKTKPRSAPADEVLLELYNKPLSFELNLNILPNHPWLHDRGIPSPAVEHLGIGVASRGLMKDRLAFPIHNEDGELVAYAGRYPSDDVPSDEPKWKLPDGFHKQLVLYNLERNRPGRHTVFLVESFLSVASHFCVTNGAIVAAMGHVLSDEQVALLRDRGITRVSIAFDGDDVGRKGAMEAAGKLAAAGIWAKVADIPDGMKPHQMTYPELIAAHNRTSLEDARAYITANSRKRNEEERKSHSWWQRVRAA